MSAEDLTHHKKKLFTAAMLYYSRIQPYCAPDFKDPAVTQFWFECLSGVDSVALKHALESLVISGKRFPAIGDIKEALGILDRDPEDEARIIIANITAAISKFGLPNEADAKEWLGELPWRVVTLNGGWRRVCAVEYDDLPTLQAQWRHLAESVVRDNRIIGNPNRLPESKETGNQLPIGTFLELSKGEDFV